MNTRILSAVIGVLFVSSAFAVDSSRIMTLSNMCGLKNTELTVEIKNPPNSFAKVEADGTVKIPEFAKEGTQTQVRCPTFPMVCNGKMTVVKSGGTLPVECVSSPPVN
jgi:hypothetical protein